MMSSKKEISTAKIVGKNYGDFWKSRHRYLVAKGSRGSKKSKTAAVKLIKLLTQYKEANALVVRNTYNTLQDSCFNELKWAMRQLEVEHMWRCTTSPLKMINAKTNQQIIFRGLDDPLKLTSITVDYGHLNFMWLEEAYEVTNEETFNKIDESLRGKLPDGYFYQIILTLNPWNERHWIKERFFDVQEDNVLALTKTYLDNEFIDEDFLANMERMKRLNPTRYAVAGLGQWGVSEGLVFENFVMEEFDIEEIKKHHRCFFGLDFGYTNDPTAFACVAYDKENSVLYVFDDSIYSTGLSNEKIAEMVEKLGYRKETITADSAEPKSIERLRTLGLERVKKSAKGPDSIKAGIDFIQSNRVVIHPRCKNAFAEFTSYVWKKDKFGKSMNVPADTDNHFIDALRYALEDAQRPQQTIQTFSRGFF